MALTESLFPVIAPQIGAYSVAGEVPPALGNRDRVAAPQGCYPTRSLPEEPESERLTDDRWIAITCRDDDEWQALLGTIGSETLRADPRFATIAARHEHHDDLDAILNEWTARHDSLELMHRLQAAGVPAVALMPDSDVMDDPHEVARGYFAAVDHRAAGKYRAPGPIWRSQRHDIRLRTPAHGLGEHNREVLQGLLGVDDREFEQLEAQGIIGEAYSAHASSASR
jgi:crotonobetainyl-CoA:carnitine CoA-transferase CaiB-like acyl-CoA transferase